MVQQSDYNLASSVVQEEKKESLSFSLFAFLTGIIGVLLVIDFMLEPSPSNAAEQLASFQSNEFLYNLHAVLIAVIALTGIPFFAGLSTTLRSKGNALALGAALLTAAGLVTIAIDYTLFTGILNAIVSVNAPSSAAASYEAAIWSVVEPYMESLGAFIAGVGFIIIGLLSWNSKVFPNWLSVIAFIGGAGGLAAYFFNPAIFLACALIWAFASGILTIRRRANQS